MVTVNPVSDLDELVRTVASQIIDVVSKIQATSGGRHNDGVARLVLTGGTAGVRVLSQLRDFDAAADEQAETFPAQRIDWSRV